MERELWSELNAAVAEVDASWREPRRYVHPTAAVVRVHLWAALHDRPVSWACQAKHWLPLRPSALPDQSTMSRRTRGKHGASFEVFCRAVGEALERRNVKVNVNANASRLLQLRRLDGKPLPVAAHSTDRDARWGRGAGQRCKGYKLHALTSAGRAMPEQWAVAPLDVDERVIARRFITRLDGAGYVLADAMYDAADLHERGAGVNHRLLAPRGKPGGGFGHRRQSRWRVRCVQQLEVPPGGSRFGRRLHGEHRGHIERDFGNLVGFGGGLTCLPPWARRSWRVRHWVHAKLLINAARIVRLARLRA
jgi:hypothetical protein